MDDLHALLPHLADVAAGIAAPERYAPPPDTASGQARLAARLERHGLGPVGHAAFRHDRAMANLLAPSAFRAAAENLTHLETLTRIERRLAADRIDMVLLKGAAVAPDLYADTSLRPMRDIDLWIGERDLPRAAKALADEGFEEAPADPRRPPALQRQSGGEIPFRRRGGGFGMIELHYSAFQGWWIRRTAAPDLDAVRDRAVPSGADRHARRLSTEDAILQTAFHVAVNQFAQTPLKGIMDIAVLARRRRVDWGAVCHRARAWRIATATWLVLETADRLMGLPCGAPAIRSLRPSLTRRAILRGAVGPSSVIASRDLTPVPLRYPFMLALVDRGRDGARLVGRTLWPERWWIDARYGRPGSRLGHLRALVRRGGV